MNQPLLVCELLEISKEGRWLNVLQKVIQKIANTRNLILFLFSVLSSTVS